MLHGFRRAFGLLFSLSFVLATTEMPRWHACPVHEPDAAAASPQREVHGADHATHHAATGQTSHKHDAKQCCCLGKCVGCAVTTLLVVAPAARPLVASPAAVPVAAALHGAPAPRPHSRPFSTAPPGEIV